MNGRRDIVAAVLITTLMGCSGGGATGVPETPEQNAKSDVLQAAVEATLAAGAVRFKGQASTPGTLSPMAITPLAGEVDFVQQRGLLRVDLTSEAGHPGGTGRIVNAGKNAFLIVPATVAQAAWRDVVIDTTWVRVDRHAFMSMAEEFAPLRQYTHTPQAVLQVISAATKDVARAPPPSEGDDLKRYTAVVDRDALTADGLRYLRLHHDLSDTDVVHAWALIDQQGLLRDVGFAITSGESMEASEEFPFLYVWLDFDDIGEAVTIKEPLQSDVTDLTNALDG